VKLHRFRCHAPPHYTAFVKPTIRRAGERPSPVPLRLWWRRRLIHLAHAHLVFEEVNKVSYFMAVELMVVPFELFCWTMLGNREVLGGADPRWNSKCTAEATLNGALTGFFGGLGSISSGCQECAPENSSAVNLQHYFHVNKIPSLASGIIENPVLQPVAALSV
jgi:hypothetical protein